MSWEYRICSKTHTYNGEPHVSYGIYEVYYNKDNSIYGITENPKAIVVDQFEDDTEQVCVDEIVGSFKLMQLALAKPVINIDEVNFSSVEE